MILLTLRFLSKTQVQLNSILIMAQLLHGALNLSAIPKELITTNKQGQKVVWIDVVERRTPGQYGETHSITLYNKNTGTKIYLADLKPQEFGATRQAAPAPAATPRANYRQAPAPAPQPAPAPVVAKDEDGDSADLPF